MKIPDEILGMSKAKRREWVKAINEVYDGYKKAIWFADCPFCVASRPGCIDCLWMIIEKIDCDNYAKDKNCYDLGVPDPRDLSYPKWKRIRYPMLRKWRRMLVEAGI